jgi:glycosyltransferase involved in cell wall biosynthesis
MDRNQPYPSILLVNHTSNRSGAPLLLYTLARHLQKHYPGQVAVLCMRNGPLVQDFSTICRTYRWPVDPEQPGGPIQKSFQKFRAWQLLQRLRQYDIVVYNTLANGHIHKKIHHPRQTVHYYVHELAGSIAAMTTPDLLDFMKAHTHQFICVSKAVSNHLSTLGIESSKLKVAATPFDSKQVQELIARTTPETNKILDAWRLKFVVLALGTNEPRKGYDLFLQLVRQYLDRYPDAEMHFVWKGYQPHYNSAYYDQLDYQNHPYRSQIELLPPDNQAMPLLANAAVHILLSREDPYPLVMLEAAACSIPTLAFAGTGGATEFVADDCGAAVPYADLQAMVEALHRWKTNPEVRILHGKNAFEKLKRWHEPEASFQQLQQYIRSGK